MALTSLFRKSFTKITNKFSILLPNGGIIYFFMEDQENWPILVIASHNHDFSTPLTKEGIKVRELPKQEYERERIVVEGQYIQLFYGYFLNWILAKNLSI
jgi:hypothetical protein